jgi:hypothetical protein
MDAHERPAGSLKDKVQREFVEYAINVVYLTLVFAAFTEYRRLVLAAQGIEYGNYWFALIEAVVLGKVIMIGGVFHLGRGLEDKPLVYPALYKTVAFVVFVLLFKVLEHAIRALWNGAGLADALGEYFAAKGMHEVIANSLIVVVAFFPFFAMKELSRVYGGARMFALFFRRTTGTQPE